MTRVDTETFTRVKVELYPGEGGRERGVPVVGGVTSRAIPRRAGRRDGRRVFAAIDAVSLVLSGVFYGGARSAFDAHLPNCDRQDACAEYSRYQSFLAASNVTLGVGAVALASGVVWWVVAKVTAGAPPQTAFLPVSFPDDAGLGVSGSF